jgi:cysteinyl-tRNA synthetase
MSKKYLGATFDIHGGGKDLIFPHHENEIAQSCGASGMEFANLWMHHGFVTIKDEKMSKSLGNFLTIRDVLQQFSAEELRLFIFSTQYRNPLDFSEHALQDARAGLERMYDCLAKIEQLPAVDEQGPQVVGKKDRDKLESLEERFQHAMDNDFNTAQALGLLFDAVKTLNKVLRAAGGQVATDDYNLLTNTAATIKQLGEVVGILQHDPVEVMQQKKEQLLAAIDLSEAEISSLIEKRNQARANKDWATSDEVRDTLLASNIVLNDGPDGTTWDVT